MPVETKVIFSRTGTQEQTGPDGIRAPLAQARHMPGYVYSSSEVFQEEKQKIFMKTWLCVARAEEIEHPGDYLTFNLMGEPFVVTRDLAGQINAFANVCAHRGVEVVKGKGNSRRFTCPYHGWNYDLTGKLVGAAFMAETSGFSKQDCRLKPLKTGTWAGWIFVSFDALAEPFESFVEVFDKDFGFLRQQDCRLATKMVTELDCNWKLAVENLIDFYHLGVVHARTNGKYYTPQKFDLKLRRRGGYIGFYDSGPSTASGKPEFGPMPWLSDRPASFSVTGRLAPTMTMFARIDDVHPIILWPLSPSRTRVSVFTLLPAIYFNEPDFARRVQTYHDFQANVMEEDRALVDSLQRAMSSDLFTPGRLSFLERGVHHVANDYLARMYGYDYQFSESSSG
jgi:phenylpropionate dioxygenase-like ring-hydroxylating dioxygenase large terminal subunit